jgi:hypothetical protein
MNIINIYFGVGGVFFLAFFICYLFICVFTASKEEILNELLSSFASSFLAGLFWIVYLIFVGISYIRFIIEDAHAEKRNL